MLLVIALAAATAAAWGGFGAALALRSGTASVVQGIFPIIFVIIFLSSAFFPGNLLLEPAKSISDWNPMSFIAEGIRDPIVVRHLRASRCSRAMRGDRRRDGARRGAQRRGGSGRGWPG